MIDNLPNWADELVSKDLPLIREAGENDKVEFKGDFPPQIHDLAKELAAFGTSGGGLLFIGINDNWEIVGIDAPNGDTRDALVRRVRGIVSLVRPELDTRIGFAIENGLCALFVEVPAQNEPVFYYNGRPYIRYNDESRPATPREVQECVWAHPSSNYKREEERINLEMQQLQLRGAQDHQQTMTDLSRNRLDSNDIIRRTLGM